MGRSLLTASREGSTLRLLVAGQFDRVGAGRVERAFEEALKAPTEHVVLDLDAVT